MSSAEVSTLPVERPADVIPLERGPRSRLAATIGMLLFLLSWGVTFAGLFMAYIILRWRAHHWPPPDVPHLPHTLPVINTVVALASSYACERAVKAAKRARPVLVRRWMLAAGVLASIFLTLQAFVWTHLWGVGLHLGQGQAAAPAVSPVLKVEVGKEAFAGIFYTLTWFHGAHVLAGLMLLLALTPRALRGAFTPRNYAALKYGAWFWHFVTVAWLGVFLAFYSV